jgi:hypothetical protein
MASEEDYLLRPVLRGMCQYESLKNGNLDLLDICKMNEALDVQAENQFRIRNIS